MSILSLRDFVTPALSLVTALSITVVLLAAPAFAQGEAEAVVTASSVQCEEAFDQVHQADLECMVEFHACLENSGNNQNFCMTRTFAPCKAEKLRTIKAEYSCLK